MDRLTKTYADGSHGVADDLPCGENSYDYKKLLIECVGKYEDTGLTPEEIMDGKMLTGWIPVEEQLPEPGQYVLVWYEYFRYGEYNRMFQTHGIAYHFDGFWSGDVSGTKAKCIAWMPLPESYKPEKDQL